MPHDTATVSPSSIGGDVIHCVNSSMLSPSVPGLVQHPLSSTSTPPGPAYDTLGTGRAGFMPLGFPL